MSAPVHDTPARGARDRVLDLLGLGDAYPLTDLDVGADSVKVAYGVSAQIPIESSQLDVTYQLCNARGEPLANYAAAGNGDTLCITSPPIVENVTYRILATKKPGPTLPPQTGRLLGQSASIQVGVDAALAVEILNAPLLDLANTNPQPSDPRIVPHGASVDVQVSKSQEGVEYSLVVEGRDLASPRQMGNLAAITLATGPMTEDAVIQVRATKTFTAAENKEPLLATTLYLKVMANPALAVSVGSAPIAAYKESATIKVAGTQKSARYLAFIRAVSDRDFVHGAAASAALATTGQPDVQVRLPAITDPRRPPGGYVALAPAALPGVAGDVTFTSPALTADSLVIVQVTKEHQVDPKSSRTIPSTIWLAQGAAVLVRPDPSWPLRLRVPLTDGKSTKTLEVLDGQPGVFYHFRPAPTGAEYPQAAYFYKRDEQDATQNMGVGQLGVEIDFVVAADAVPGSAAAGGSPSTAAPRAPILDVATLQTGSTLSARAVKAQTAVDAAMTRTARIAGVPAIRAAQDMVDDDTPATIVIPVSTTGDRYQVTLAGTPVKAAVVGDGSDLTVVTAPLTVATTFEVVVTTPADRGMTVERVSRVQVGIRPKSAGPKS
jgi:hypothetical protein